AMLARTVKARVTLLQVIGPPMPELLPVEMAALPQDDEALAAQARDYLKRTAAWLGERGVEAETEVAFGWPADKIVKAAGGQYDLIAMATHGRGGLDRLMVGSVAETVLTKANAPLLLTRT